MRILFAYHLPLASTPIGRGCTRIAQALSAQGHATRVLLVDNHHAAHDPLPTRRVVCDAKNKAADLSFALPGFAGEPAGQLFETLSDRELSDYREASRRALDAEMAEFDPEVIHVEHVWLWGQLALETGAPYVLSAHQSEVDASRAGQPRLTTLAEQGAENAALILVHAPAFITQVTRRFPGGAERARIAPETPDEWLEVYQHALRQRFG